jgi:hypothetical protein
MLCCPSFDRQLFVFFLLFFKKKKPIIKLLFFWQYTRYITCKVRARNEWNAHT